jgi:hypothetical protein
MTSISIRQYLLGIYKQLGLREEDVTEVQTSGPDSYLGSSTCSDLLSALGWGVLMRRTDEILLSSDKTITVIDGSGVLGDPAELVRLAKLRIPVENFDKSKTDISCALMTKMSSFRVGYIAFRPFRAVSNRLFFPDSGRGCTGWNRSPEWRALTFQGRPLCSLWRTVRGALRSRQFIH